MKVYRKDGKRYVVNPLVVVWNKDNYYLACYYDKHDDIFTYRIDRMEEAKEEAAERVYRKEFDEFDIEQYRQRVFSMFGGEEQKVDLQFDSEMLDDVFDKFGEEVNIVKVDDATYQLKVPIQVSKTFMRGWWEHRAKCAYSRHTQFANNSMRLFRKSKKNTNCLLLTVNRALM